MKGKNLIFLDVREIDAEAILSLRADEPKGNYSSDASSEMEA